MIVTTHLLSTAHKNEECLRLNYTHLSIDHCKWAAELRINRENASPYELAELKFSHANNEIHSTTNDWKEKLDEKRKRLKIKWIVEEERDNTKHFQKENEDVE
jgi:hypothetical protein